ncbi:MAG: hypothetical protein IJB27_07485 [Clostridia bacterium]|nr:hypothetical protein [Clostridia bacterium]
MFEYVIATQYDVSCFKSICERIEAMYPDWQKDRLLIDVDCSLIQAYHNNDNEITVFCCIEEDVVWVESTIEMIFLA